MQQFIGGRAVDPARPNWPTVSTKWTVIIIVIVAIILVGFSWLWISGVGGDRLTLATLLVALAALVTAVISLVVGVNQIRVTDAIGREQITMAVNAVEMAKKQMESTSFASGIPVINDFRKKIESNEFKELRRAAAKELLEGKDSISTEIESILNEYESIAILVEKGGMDEDLVYNYFSDWILHMFPAVEDVISVNQDENPTYYENFRKLHQRMKIIEERKGGKPQPTRTKVTEFLQSEALWGCQEPRDR